MESLHSWVHHPLECLPLRVSLGLGIPGLGEGSRDCLNDPIHLLRRLSLPPQEEFFFFFFCQQFITQGLLAVCGRHIQTLDTLRLCYAVPVMYYQNLEASFWRATTNTRPMASSKTTLPFRAVKKSRPPIWAYAHSIKPLDSTRKVPRPEPNTEVRAVARRHWFAVNPPPRRGRITSSAITPAAGDRPLRWRTDCCYSPAAVSTNVVEGHSPCRQYGTNTTRPIQPGQGAQPPSIWYSKEPNL
jgi:hypothetical protein